MFWVARVWASHGNVGGSDHFEKNQVVQLITFGVSKIELRLKLNTENGACSPLPWQHTCTSNHSTLYYNKMASTYRQYPSSVRHGYFITEVRESTSSVH